MPRTTARTWSLPATATEEDSSSALGTRRRHRRAAGRRWRGMESGKLQMTARWDAVNRVLKRAPVPLCGWVVSQKTQARQVRGRGLRLAGESAPIWHPRQAAEVLQRDGFAV